MRLEIHCQDRVGIAQEVLNILVHYQIDLRGIEVDPLLGRMYVAFPGIDFEKFQELMAKIRRIPGVDDVKTTAFLPSEREHNELSTLLKTLPDGVIGIDTKANVTIINDAALLALSVSSDEILGQSLANMVKGFNFLRWLESDDVLAQTRRFEIHGKRFVADVLPVMVPDETGHEIRTCRSPNRTHSTGRTSSGPMSIRPWETRGSPSKSMAPATAALPGEPASIAGDSGSR